MKVSLEKPGTPEELMHFGVRGMKWGVRKLTDSGGQTTRLHPGITSYRPGSFNATRQARKLSKSETGFNVPNMLRMSEVHQAALPGIRKDLVKVNRSPRNVKNNASFSRSYTMGMLQRNHPARVKYDSQVEAIVRKNYQDTINNTYGKKYPKLSFEVVRIDNKIVDGSRLAVKVYPKSVKHASANEDPSMLEFEVKYIRDNNGFVTDIDLNDLKLNEISQTMDKGSNFLLHIGLKV